MHRSSATALTLAVLAVLATGCSDDGSDTNAVPGTPTSAAGAPTGEATPDPVTSAATATTTPTAGTAANTAQVCHAVDQLIIDGSRQIAADWPTRPGGTTRNSSTASSRGG